MCPRLTSQARRGPLCPSTTYGGPPPPTGEELRLSRQQQRLAFRLPDGRLSLLGTDVHAVCGDELGLDADELECHAQVAFEVLHRGGGRIGAVEAAARQRDDHPL